MKKSFSKMLVGPLLFLISLWHCCIIAAGSDIIVLYFASASDTSGTVKARVNGSPGPGQPDRTICWDSNWGIEEANVVCGQMGFLNAASLPTAVNTNNPILFDVRCKGTETNLVDCSYKLTGTCAGNKGVAVTCIPNPAFTDLFDARLKGDAAHKGIAEVRRTFSVAGDSRPWFVFCYNHWSVEESQVICRQLGYNGVKATRGFIGTHPNVDDAELSCGGTEQTLRGCNTNPSPSTCTNKTSFPEVECKLDSVTQQPFDVRLTHGNESSGTVEVKKYGRWGYICGNTWTLDSARVVCQQLGFVDVISVTKDATFGQSGLPMFLRKPECKAGDWSISECPGADYGWGGGVKTCASKNTAGVVCNPTKFPSYDISTTSPTPNAAASSGRFFLESPGYPQTFTYAADSHLVCTMTADTVIQFSLYVHYKMFQQNHQETLSFQAADTQVSGSGNFYSLDLYGDDSNPGPYTTKTKSHLVDFKSNGATGKGKIRVEVRVSSGSAVALDCMKPTTTAPPIVPTTTTATTASTALDVTSTGNHPTTVTLSIIPSSPKDGTHGTSPITTDGTGYTQAATAEGSGVNIGLFMAVIVVFVLILVVIIIIAVVLWKLGFVVFQKPPGGLTADDTGASYDDTGVEFSAIRDSAPTYVNTGPIYVNDGFVADGGPEGDVEAYVDVGDGRGAPGQDERDYATPYSEVRVAGRVAQGKAQRSGDGEYDDVGTGPRANAIAGPRATHSYGNVSGQQPGPGGARGETHADSPYADLREFKPGEYEDLRGLTSEQLKPV